jgi:hypothetical protein
MRRGTNFIRDTQNYRCYSAHSFTRNLLNTHIQRRFKPMLRFFLSGRWGIITHKMAVYWISTPKYRENTTVIQS